METPVIRIDLNAEVLLELTIGRSRSEVKSIFDHFNTLSVDKIFFTYYNGFCYGFTMCKVKECTNKESHKPFVLFGDIINMILDRKYKEQVMSKVTKFKELIKLYELDCQKHLLDAMDTILANANLVEEPTNG